MSSLSRRELLLGGAALALGGATLGAGGVLASARLSPDREEARAQAIPFHGEHQAGVTTPAQAHALLLALDLLPGTDRDALRRLMRLLSDDAARLTQGRPALADTEPELAAAPARLTVTFGFGPGLVARAGGAAPSWLAPLPPFGVDRLEPAWCGGDLLLQVCADDRLTAAHAARVLLKDARAFARPRWRQDGFLGSRTPAETPRNLFGQVDGTVNPAPEEHAELVWSDAGWLAGGTGMVVRRIRMDLDGWDRLDRPGRELAVGRYLSNGAPLTSDPEDPAAELDEPDLGATGELGFPVIPAYSHVARARGTDRRERFLRRSFNYDDGTEAGLVFVAFAADVERQFLPVQRRLAELDMLNEWTTPVGSAVFAVPPGCAEGGFVGETLLA